MVSYGERLSSKIVTAAFGAMGLNSALVDAREVMITDGQHAKAVPLVDEVDCRSQKIIAPLLAAGRVPVIGGFIGATKDGVQTTIGRGGSDYSAALFGAALNAEVIEIWTDVDGMMTTDPNICPDAHRIKVISFEEAAELAYFGAKVLHPGDGSAGGQEEHPRAGAQLAQSEERRHADRRRRRRTPSRSSRRLPPKKASPSSMSAPPAC